MSGRRWWTGLLLLCAALGLMVGVAAEAWRVGVLIGAEVCAVGCIPRYVLPLLAALRGLWVERW